MAQWTQGDRIVNPDGTPTREFLLWLEKALERRNVWVAPEPHPEPELNDIWIATEE